MNVKLPLVFNNFVAIISDSGCHIFDEKYLLGSVDNPSIVTKL